MENWRNFLQEELSGNKATAYHGSETPPEEFPKILKDWKSGKGSGKAQYGNGAYLVLDEDKFESKTFDGRYGQHLYKLEVDLTGFVIFNPEAAQEVHGANTSVAAQLRDMGKPEVIEALKEHLADRAEQVEREDDERTTRGGPDADINLSQSKYSWAHNPLALEGKLETELDDLGNPRAWNALAQEYAPVLQDHVNGVLFAAGSEDNRVIAVYKPEIMVPIAHLNLYKQRIPTLDGKKIGFGEEAAEQWLASRKKGSLDSWSKGMAPEEFQKFKEEWEPNEHMQKEYERIKRGYDWEPL